MKPARLLPSAAETLLLRAACLDSAAGLSAWREWLAAAGSIDAAGYREGVLLPMVYRNLAPLGDEVPGLARLKGTYRMAWYRNQLRAGQVAAALEALHAAGIPTMLLKGAALLAHYDADAGARYMEDADVLVPRSAAPAAVAALRAVGWTPSFFVEQPLTVDERIRRALRFAHAVDLRGPEREAQIDLHWAALLEHPHPSFDDGLWARSLPAHFRGVPTRVPSRGDLLAHVCINGLRPPGQTARWAADAAILARSMEATDWAVVEREAMVRQSGAVAGAALACLEAELGLPVPAGLAVRLSGQRLPLAWRLEARPYDRRFWRQYHFVGRYLALARRESPLRVAAMLPDYLAYTWGVPSRRALFRDGVRRGWREVRIRTVRPARRAVRRLRAPRR
jgi:hypothetical protein